MAKKYKNKRKLEANRKKRDAASLVSKYGLRLDDDICTVNFVFTHLGMSHLNYMAFKSINKLCKEYFGINISVFTEHMVSKCVQLLCPVFNIADIDRINNSPAVSTNISTTIACIHSNCSSVYYYCFDPEFVKNCHYNIQQLRDVFLNPKVKIITRHKSHRQLIETEFGIKTHDIILQDFDASKFVQIAISESRNE